MSHGAPPDMVALRMVADAQYRDLIARQRARGEIDVGELAPRVQRLFGGLVSANALDARDWRWEIHITSDRAVTAFSMAGGKLLVGGGYVERLQLDDAELAMLVAHEMGHVVGSHVRSKPSQALAGDAAADLHEARLAIDQELEADDLGIGLALRAGWKPAELVRFFDKLAADEPAGTFNATHPTAAMRAERAHERLFTAEPPK
jgi:predicted Zn-dependent protease